MWPIIVFIMLALIGSIFWLKPSARDQRLADLRLQAMKLGLAVKHQTFNPESAKNGVRDSISGTTYSLFVEDPKASKDVIFRIVFQGGWDAEQLPEGFSWHDKISKHDLSWFQSLELIDQLDAVTDQLMLLEVCGNRVTMMAAEQVGADARQYQSLLTSLLAAIAQR